MDENKMEVHPDDRKKLWISIIVTGASIFIGTFVFDAFGPSIPIGIALSVVINAVVK
jgi:hypothetical protein